MDFIEGLSLSYGHFVIMTVVDRLIKYTNFVVMRHSFMIASVAKIFIANVK